MNTYSFTFADTDDLILEHFSGNNSGLLGMAQDFTMRFLATHGLGCEDQLVEAAAEEGFGEAEIAAALEIINGDYSVMADPRGMEWMIK